MEEKIAPNIYRQRLLIEANSILATSAEIINQYLIGICNEFGVSRATGKPFEYC
jgi:hypothetical protein